MDDLCSLFQGFQSKVTGSVFLGLLQGSSTSWQRKTTKLMASKKQRETGRAKDQEQDTSLRGIR